MISVVLFSLLSTTSWFDGKSIYENPVAYVRSSESGVAIKSSEYRGARLKYIDAAIGKVVPIVRYENIQLGLEAGTWMILGYHEGRFPLITQDFLLSVPLMFRFENISGALKFGHISSHRGDGFDVLWEKTLSPEEKQKIEMVEEQQNISISPPIKNYSRDFFSLEMSKETKIKQLKIKSYSQIAYIHKIIPHNLGRWFGGGGNELQLFGFYTAADFHYYQDTHSFDFSGQTGFVLNDHETQPRVYLSVYRGSDRRGQLLGRTMTEYSIGFSVR